MSRFYLLKNKTPVPVSLMEWAVAFEKDEERKVARDEFDGIVVSTVFLGLDHSFGDGPPVLFETMVFGGPLDQEMDRYSTFSEAEAGHAAMVARAKGGQ